MLKLVVVHTVKAEFVEKIMDTAAELVKKSQQEPGCISYTFVKDSLTPNKFLFLEEWESEAALEVHGKTEHFVTICSKLGEMVEKSELYKIIL